MDETKNQSSKIMIMKKSKYIQPDLFEDFFSYTVFPKATRRGKEAGKPSVFEQLHLAIKQIVHTWETPPGAMPQYATILRYRYLDNKKDHETAQIFQKTTERIRQIRIQLIDQLINGQNKYKLRLHPELVRQLRDTAPLLEGQDADEVLHSRYGGKPLPDSLLEFVDMTAFEERSMADQRFIAPDNQTNYMRCHICELVKLLRSNYTPIEIHTAMAAMSAALDKQQISFNEKWFRQIIKSHHWIETTGTQIQLSYEGLRYPSLKIARIIYENKRIHKNDIIRIYNKRETSDENKIKEGQLALHILIKRKDKRFQCLGKTGIWTFHEEETGNAKPPLRQVLNEYLSAHDGVINLREAETHVRSLGYDYPLHTLRCYLLKECVSSIADSDLLCRQDCVSKHPETPWRKRLPGIRRSCKEPPYYHEIIRKMKELLEHAEGHRLPKKQIAKTCKAFIPGTIAKTMIYKIINNKTGDSIRQVQIDGVDYLLLNDAGTEE